MDQEDVIFIACVNESMLLLPTLVSGCVCVVNQDFRRGKIKEIPHFSSRGT